MVVWLPQSHWGNPHLCKFNEAGCKLLTDWLTDWFRVLELPIRYGAKKTWPCAMQKTKHVSCFRVFPRSYQSCGFFPGHPLPKRRTTSGWWSHLQDLLTSILSWNKDPAVAFFPLGGWYEHELTAVLHRYKPRTPFNTLIRAITNTQYTPLDYFYVHRELFFHPAFALISLPLAPKDVFSFK